MSLEGWRLSTISCSLDVCRAGTLGLHFVPADPTSQADSMQPILRRASLDKHITAWRGRGGERSPAIWGRGDLEGNPRVALR